MLPEEFNMVKGFIRTKTLKKEDKSEVLNQIYKGNYVKIRNGLYANRDNLYSNMIDIPNIVPNGILCLYSAWYHYDMTTKIPEYFYVAIDRNRKSTLPQSIGIKLVYVTEKILDIGKTMEKIDGYDISIYNRERCVCDAVKYRNKIGLDVMQEIIDSYINNPEKDFSLLMNYAKKLRVYSKLKTYMEVKI